MPNQINEDELQKAIDDITNSAQGDAGAGEMPAEAAPGPVAPAPEAGAPAPEAAPMPDFNMPPMPPVPPAPGAFDAGAIAPLEGVVPVPPAPEAMPAPEPVPAVAPEPVAAPEAETPEAATPEPAPMIAPAEGTPEAVVVPEVPVAESAPVEVPAEVPAPEMDAGTEQIKAEILRDLSPLMDKVEMEPEKKFHIYKDMMTTNNDKSVIPSAYETAKLIGDDQQRGEALVSLIDAIDS